MSTLNISSINSIVELIELQESLLVELRELEFSAIATASTNTLNYFSCRAKRNELRSKIARIGQRIKLIRRRRELHEIKRKNRKLEAEALAAKSTKGRDNEITSQVISLLAKELGKANSKKARSTMSATVYRGSLSMATGAVDNSNSNPSGQSPLLKSEDFNLVSAIELDEDSGNESFSDPYMQKAIEDVKSGAISASSVWNKALAYKTAAENEKVALQVLKEEGD